MSHYLGLRPHPPTMGFSESSSVASAYVVPHSLVACGSRSNVWLGDRVTSKEAIWKPVAIIPRTSLELPRLHTSGVLAGQRIECCRGGGGYLVLKLDKGVSGEMDAFAIVIRGVNLDVGKLASGPVS